MLDGRAEEARPALDRRVEVVDGNADVVNAHAARIELPGCVGAENANDADRLR